MDLGSPVLLSPGQESQHGLAGPIEDGRPAVEDHHEEEVVPRALEEEKVEEEEPARVLVA